MFDFRLSLSIHPCNPQGLKCPGRDCPVHVHLFCYDRLISANRHQCKHCKISWRTSEPTPVGEDAIPRREDDYATSRRGKKRGTGGGAASNGADEEDELEDEEDEGESRANGTQNPSQMVDLESEEEEDERPAQRVRRR
jgi:hypothetical protein